MVRAPPMREAIDVFGEWAEVGKDEGMERGHAAAVEEMLEFIYQRAKDLENRLLSPIWVVGMAG